MKREDLVDKILDSRVKIMNSADLDMVAKESYTSFGATCTPQDAENIKKSPLYSSAMETMANIQRKTLLESELTDDELEQLLFFNHSALGKKLAEVRFKTSIETDKLRNNFSEAIGKKVVALLFQHISVLICEVISDSKPGIDKIKAAKLAMEYIEKLTSKTLFSGAPGNTPSKTSTIPQPIQTDLSIQVLRLETCKEGERKYPIKK